MNEENKIEIDINDLTQVSGGDEGKFSPYETGKIKKIKDRLLSQEFKNVPFNIRKQIAEDLEINGIKHAKELGIQITKDRTPARKMVNAVFGGC